MRSQLVYDADHRIENRFLLAAVAMRAARKLLLSSTRTEDTVNTVLVKVAKSRCAHGALPQIAPSPDLL